MIDYNIISTGSQGNAIIINDKILIDCGVPFKQLKPYYKGLKIVLLTHIHSDHFNKTTIKKLAGERPTLRFACGRWLAEPLIQCGVEKSNIDVVEYDTMYRYGLFDLIPVPLVHNVPNCGYKLHFPNGEKMIYATDTNNLNGITAKNYNLYLIEADYEDEEIRQRIREKKENGEYAYEMQVLKNHLSKEKCNDFICQNIGPNGIFVYMHCHKDSDTNDNDGENTEV